MKVKNQCASSSILLHLEAKYVGFQVVTAACMKCVVFWFSLSSASAGFLLDLLFDPENRGDMLLQNIRFHPKHTALKPRIPYSSR
jgi:hypothetical protein